MRITPVGGRVWLRVYRPDAYDCKEGGHQAGKHYVRPVGDNGVMPLSPPFDSAADALLAALKCGACLPGGVTNRPVGVFAPVPIDRLDLSARSRDVPTEPDAIPW